MCTARPGYKSITMQTLTYKKRLHRIAVDLPDILHVDEKARTVRVEPCCTIGQLNDYLVEKGWTLPVVPEIDDLTIGGLVMGGGIESTSHKYGLFQYICRSFEVVLADGSVTECSAKDNPDLFSAIPFSYGTLGFVTAVTIDIIPYQPYVKLSYRPVFSLEEAIKVFRRATVQEKNDSVEGIMFGLNEGVIMTGNFIDEFAPADGHFNKIGRWYKPWFHEYVRSILRGSKKRNGNEAELRVDIIPTTDFFHRHNRSCFWMLDYLIPFGNNPLFRYPFGWCLPPKHALIKWLKEKFVPPEVLDKFVCQDFGIKLEDLKEMVEEVDEVTQVYPLWLCPTRHMIPEGLEHLAFFKREDIHIDVGVYGFTEKPEYDRVESQRRMERFVIDRDAYVALYAETQLSRDEFDEMLKHSLRTYEKLRKELKCEGAFPHVYEKISKLGRK